MLLTKGSCGTAPTENFEDCPRLKSGETNYTTLLTAQRTYPQTHLNHLDSVRSLRRAEVEIDGRCRRAASIVPKLDFATTRQPWADRLNQSVRQGFSQIRMNGRLILGEQRRIS